MKKLYSVPGLVLSVLFLIASYYFISKSVAASEEFKHEKVKIVEILNFNDRLLSVDDWLFTERAWLEKKEKFDVVVEKADASYQTAVDNGYYLLFAALGFLVIMVIIYALQKRIFFGVTLGSSVVGLALLGQGIMNPILEMSAFKEDLTIKVHVDPDEIPVVKDMQEYIGQSVEGFEWLSDKIRIIPFGIGESVADKADEYIAMGKEYVDSTGIRDVKYDHVFPGRTYFYYQNKGIMDVISILWESGNRPVALAIGTFSVLIPSIKLIFTILLLILPVHGMKRFRKFLSYIAKWSMADVFVVAAFLSYLSFANMSPGVDMDAKVLFGLYYFAGYVIVSILLGIFLDLSIKEKIRLKEAAEKEKEPNLPESTEEM